MRQFSLYFEKLTRYSKKATIFFLLLVCIKGIQAQAPVLCNTRDIQFSPYRNIAPSAGTLSATFYNNDQSNSITFSNTGTYSAGKPAWNVQGSQSNMNNLVSVTAGTGNSTSNQVTTMTLATASDAYIFQVADLNSAATEEVEITGYDNSNNPVYPVKSSGFQGGDFKDNGSGVINLAYDADGGSQGAVSYYFTTTVKRVEAVQRGLQNNIFNRIQGCTLLADFSDAPVSFGSCSALTTSTTMPLKLGSNESTEASNTLNSLASGDATGDDGVTFFPVISGASVSATLPVDYSVNVTASNSFGSNATVFAWLDWNGNGIFEGSEGLSQSITNGTTNGIFTFTWPAGTTVTGTTGTPGMYARFRISNDAALTVSAASANSLNGEIEDYFIPYSEPLPLQLLSFQVEKSGSDVKLHWTTAEEINTDSTLIEHSLNGSTYNEIGRVATLNNRGQVNSYEFKHHVPFAGNNYYRLKMIDTDNSFRYSPVRLIYVGDTGNVSLYPNPVSDIATLTGMKPGSEIKLWTIGGRIVNKQFTTSGTVKLDMSKLSPGIYLVEIIDNGMRKDIITMVLL